MIKAKPDEIPPHESSPEETETLELIQALLQTGGKVIKGNEWINDLKGGYFLIRVQVGDQLYPFKSSISLPFIIGPDGIS